MKLCFDLESLVFENVFSFGILRVIRLGENVWCMLTGERRLLVSFISVVELP